MNTLKVNLECPKGHGLMLDTEDRTVRVAQKETREGGYLKNMRYVRCRTCGHQEKHLL